VLPPGPRYSEFLSEGCAEFGEGGDDLVAEGVGFFVVEVGVHAAELQSDGEGMGAVGDALAFIDIEEPVVFEVGAAGLDDGLVDFGERHILLDEDGDVAAGGRVARDSVVGGDSELLGFEAIEGEFGHDGGGGKVGLFGDGGVDLAHDADFGLSEHDFGLSGGVEAWVGGASFVGNGEVGGGGDGFEAAFEGEEVGGCGVGGSPAGGVEFSGTEEGDLGEFAGFGVDAADFEDVDVFEVVATLGVGERWEEAVSEVGHFGAVGLADTGSSWCEVPTVTGRSTRVISIPFFGRMPTVTGRSTRRVIFSRCTAATRATQFIYREV